MVEEESRATGNSVVRCCGITKYFGGVRALNRVSLGFRSGEVVALVGDNGAGKSTLVKILSGIYPPDGGSIWLGDIEVKNLDPRCARDFGIETIYQNLCLCDNLGAADNVMLGQEPIRFALGPFRFIDQKRSKQDACRHIHKLGVTIHDLFSPVQRLSGGQRQAIAIARAMVNAHRLVQFDEPTAALGLRQTKATLELIRAVASHGVAVIVISHNLEDVFSVADRIVVLRLGTIELDAPTYSISKERVVACMTGVSF